jgi:hypothetical protein
MLQSRGGGSRVRIAFIKHAFDLCVATLIVALCLIMFATQAVNPYTVDGWFESGSLILERNPGGDNHSPVGAPAFLYATVHWLVRAAGGGLREEFYAGSLAHNLMLAGSALLLYATHRRLGLPRMGAFSSLGLVLLIQSTWMTQACWSENTSLLLNATTIFAVVFLATRPELSPRGVTGSSAVIGGLLGISTITRMVPLLLLPLSMWFLWRTCGRLRARQFAIIATPVLIVLLVAAGAANAYRYGRFELTNSTGRHLWSGIREISEQLLGESESYQHWKRLEPDLPGKPWWDIHTFPPGVAHGPTLDAALREMIVPGLRRHPLLFLENGLRRAWGCYRRGLGRFGYVQSITNPLGISTPLPPPIARWDGYTDLLGRIGSMGDRRFGFLYLAVIVCGIARMVLWRGDAPRRRLWLFLALAYFLPTCVTWILEQPEPRYAIPYLSTLALLVSVSIAPGTVVELGAASSPKGGE